MVLALLGMTGLLVYTAKVKQNASHIDANFTELYRIKEHQSVKEVKTAIAQRLKVQDYIAHFDNIHKLYNIAADAIDPAYLRQADDEGKILANELKLDNIDFTPVSVYLITRQKVVGSLVDGTVDLSKLREEATARNIAYKQSLLMLKAEKNKIQQRITDALNSFNDSSPMVEITSTQIFWLLLSMALLFFLVFIIASVGFLRQGKLPLNLQYINDFYSDKMIAKRSVKDNLENSSVYTGRNNLKENAANEGLKYSAVNLPYSFKLLFEKLLISIEKENINEVKINKVCEKIKESSSQFNILFLGDGLK
jgi:hypothetical protein